MQHLPPTGDSAVYRARHPRSWWWTPTHDFLSLAVQALQGANWQRSGNKGSAPKRIERPDDRPPQVKTAAELAERRAAQREELARRRARREQQRQQKGA